MVIPLYFIDYVFVLHWDYCRWPVGQVFSKKVIYDMLMQHSDVLNVCDFVSKRHLQFCFDWQNYRKIIVDWCMFGHHKFQHRGSYNSAWQQYDKLCNSQMQNQNWLKVSYSRFKMPPPPHKGCQNLLQNLSMCGHPDDFCQIYLEIMEVVSKNWKLVKLYIKNIRKCGLKRKLF